jgi:hypothetical protein
LNTRHPPNRTAKAAVAPVGLRYEVSNLIQGDKAVLIAIHPLEVRKRPPGGAPLVQRDLPVPVGIDLSEPFGDGALDVAASTTRIARFAAIPLPSSRAYATLRSGRAK